ncbi:MAG: hypothetical protein QOJ74_1536 [Ilumatobacteraceae bacterium]|nr:hypothetical protein [Ilumatobacteraceae bacterium]
MTVASMAMYPFPQLRPAYDRLWEAVRRQLPFEAPLLEWQLAAEVACRRPDLLLGQTCGWPLITELRSSVQVVGTFDCDVEGGRDATYCSVIISGREEDVGDILRAPDSTVAANSSDSLSGWISLQAVAAGEGVNLDAVEWTGSHADSAQAVRDGRADLASIDAVSWTHFDHAGLSVVGHGPRVPCLPLVTAVTSPDAVVSSLRGAFASVVADPSMAETCAALRIRGFVERRLADYEELSSLAQVG